MMSWTSSSLLSLRANIVSTTRRSLQYINVLDQDTTHETTTDDIRLWPTMAYDRLQRKCGSKLQYVLFGSVLLFFFACAVLTIGNEMSVQEYRDSLLVSIITDDLPPPPTSNTTLGLLDSNATIHWNSTASHGNDTTIPITQQPVVQHIDYVQHDSNQPLWVTLFFMLLLWYILLQLYKVLHTNATMVEGEEGTATTTGYRADRDNARMIQQLMMMGGPPSMRTSRMRLAFLNRDFTGDDYEILRSLDDSVTDSNGIEQATIDRLPVHTITAEDLLLTTPEREGGGGGGGGGGDHHLCSICLAPYEEGEDVRIVMCMHRFHKRCIDPWLRTHPTCPVCKNRAIE